MANTGDAAQLLQKRRLQRVAFVFPMASGHINPSLPMARSLVEQGHEVHYLCREQMRQAIEDTGAVFHCEIQCKPELYHGREPDLMGAVRSLAEELDPQEENQMLAAFKLLAVQTELMLPGTLRWLRRLQPNAVVYCPLMSSDAAYAAKVLRLPSIALLTTAGPGSVEKMLREIFTSMGLTLEGVWEAISCFNPSTAALQRLSEKYGLNLDVKSILDPVGYIDVLGDSAMTLVTTSEDMYDPMTPELRQAYENQGVRFVSVGPLLDREGAHRAAGHKYSAGDEPAPPAEGHRSEDTKSVLASVRRARAAGRRVVLVSMGTVITGDSPDWGWEGRTVNADGQPRGLTGRELCQAAWLAAFDTCGSGKAEEGPLLVVALGPQPNALGSMAPPPNAICMPVVPQVDILKAGVSVFVTHGGQNSFTEALASAVPLVVCPGFGDQPVNARKAEALGVGIQVPRPEPELGNEASAAAGYRTAVASALRKVLEGGTFREEAAACAERLRGAGGVPRAVELVLDASKERHKLEAHGGA